MKILIVDNEGSDAQFTRRSLLKAGYKNIDILSRAEDALEALAHDTTIHCVISDYKLNCGEDGVTFLTQAHDNSPGRRLKLALYTGHITVDAVSPALAAAVEGLDYIKALPKSIGDNDAELVEWVSNACPLSDRRPRHRLDAIKESRPALPEAA